MNLEVVTKLQTITLTGLLYLMSANHVQAASDIKVSEINTPGCNAAVFTQLVDTPDLFLGRWRNVTDSTNGCSGNTWSLDLLKMDWVHLRFEKQRIILQTPVTIDDHVLISSAYDPYVAKFENENWVAFECVGKGIPGTSTCLGPFDLSHPEKGIDLSRTNVVVQGLPSAADPRFIYSASDPKLLTWKNKLYLYWTAVKYWYPKGPSSREVIELTVRGMELAPASNGRKVLWGKGTNSPVSSSDPQKTTEIWAINSAEPASNQTVDMFSILAIGDKIYATAGLGGTGCTTPGGKSRGCFRLVISEAKTPIGHDIFNGHILTGFPLPSNPQEYGRIFRRPDGSFSIIGNFLQPPAIDKIAAHAIPAGVYEVPLPDGLFAR